MATLKISDLSIGDWVEYEGLHYPITFVGYGEGGDGSLVNLIRPDLSCFTCKISDIHPIPITAEILVKNGWKLSKSNWFEFEDGEWKINIWTGKSKCNIEISQKREIYASTYADIQVVKSNINTLQHALRLAGVDKEIVMPNK